uniref:Sushi, von Willebrand factor type A, EGF and pentraxin domain containing 1 n=1 Tax=Ciona savignyi TaxID=51511 RepID=H2Z1V4_CIOSA
NATYFCLPGYMLSGTTTSTCEASGNWSQVCPVCSPVSCGEPDVIENGYHTAQGNYTYGEAVTFSCNRGFRLVGMSFALCNAEAQWSSSSPTCHRKSCGPAPSIPNSIFQPAELLFEDQVIYECQFGYSLIGHNTVTCDAGGYLSPHPRCQPVPCLEVPRIKHATLQTGSSYVFGDRASYQCNEGYLLSTGSNWIECTGFGTFNFSSDHVKCDPVECPRLLPPQHGSISRDRGLFKDEVTYSCDEGYNMVGPSHSRCTANATWTSAPTCEPVVCGTAPMVEHGSVVGRLHFGSSVSYHCDSGYYLSSNNSNLSCMSDGSWSPNPPVCHPVECGEPPEVKNARVPLMLYTFGMRVQYQCADGFLFASDDTAQMCLENGEFTQLNIACIPVPCPAPPLVINGHTSATSAVFGDVVTYHCKHGYVVKGEEFMECSEEGQWTADTTCEPRSCGPAPDVENAIPMRGVIRYGSSVHFECNVGYILEGDVQSLSIQCVAGRWTDQPECASLCRHRCLHKGSCIGHNQCSCAGGWTGRRCRHPTCLLPCLNGGYCSAPYTCSCATGWTGERCQTPHCSQPCRNGGQCVAPDECRCPYGYFGANCGEESSYFGL